MGKKPKKTLLLVFIHGFQGDDNTFGDFPQHLQSITAPYLPKHRVVTKVFPRYETRGDLAIAVAKLRSWLQDLVIDLETAAGTEHPMIKPSVRTVLVCHSMGGIVAADTLLAILDEQNVSGGQTPYMFPCIQGILAFDTPYLGLAPGMFAHNVDSNIKTANAAVSQAALLASSFFGSKTATDGVEKTHINDVKTVARMPPERRDSASSSSSRRDKEKDRDRSEKREHKSSRDKDKEHRSSRDKDRDREKDKHKDRSPEKEAERAERRRRRKEEEERNSLVLSTSNAPSSSSQPSTPSTPSTSSWGGWGKVAMLAGAASALAATGAAAYLKRDTLSQGFGFVTSHFEFVRELGKGETLRQRLTRASTVEGVGFANLYTSLGPRAAAAQASILPDIGMKIAAANDATKSFLAQERTFCSEPGDKSEFRRFFIKMVNSKAADEIAAHTGMFAASTNPGFYGMSECARDLIVEWAGKRGRRRSVADDLDLD